MAKLRIVSSRESGASKAKVYLDDKPLERVLSIQVTLSVGDMNTALISLIPDEVEIEGEFQVNQKMVDLLEEGVLCVVDP